MTIINIILANMDAIESTGKAGGKRARLIGKLIEAKKHTVDNSIIPLNTISTSTIPSIKRINSLQVESFRGFSVSHEFELSKQYTFFYGPNGSGKSSLCESLEFGLLGTIEEAEARKIKIDKYIKNSITGKGKKPIISCIYANDKDGKAQENYEMYRFAFIEKNRIDKFSHINASSEKNQSERISALFGLTGFNNFIREFTDSFDNRYLLLESSLKQEFEKLKIKYDNDKKRKQEIGKEVEQLHKNINTEIIKFNNNDVKDAKQAIALLNDETNGLLTKLLLSKKESMVNEIDIELFVEKINIVDKLLNCITNIRTDKMQLANAAMEMNFLDLYNAIVKLDKNDVCPACKTPLNLVSTNPYEYAKDQIVELEHIEKLKQEIETNAEKAANNYIQLKDYLESHKSIMKLLGIDSCSIYTIIETKDFQSLSQNVKAFEELLKQISDITINQEQIKKVISEYNENAKRQNIQYDSEINRLSVISKNLQLYDAKLENLESEQSKISIAIQAFEDDNQKKIKEIETEERNIQYNKRMVVAYEKICEILAAYNNQLPIKLAKDLSDKVMEYYNIMNQDDALFEKIKSISLPKNVDDKIIIDFGDGIETDALQVLSEGHIKILGLAILMAKANSDKIGFLIFDDIVNAIDDDHRDGIAELIMNCMDFKKTQIILTCHGEQFVMKLEDKLCKDVSKKDIVRYIFVPADSLDERGVVVEYTDAKSPLLVAEQNFKKNELKDAASKCRQAAECIVNNLWKKLSNKYSIQINVALRGPKSIPDLKSIVDGLTKNTGKLPGAEEINTKLKELSEKYNWMLLNKGTHFENEQKEFERGDIKDLITLLSELDEAVRNLKISVVAEVK